eukprot:TRINITY_DN34830_c2_g1_i1.p1 TRINITY_DN34830_c2_g1~~TRINITY_DN34830_c2_g1_i1.p1  ORF type:complete len:548 (+),score=88.22 TRINITY_DN34830_c2_g1_i1:25-1644(+)
MVGLLLVLVALPRLAGSFLLGCDDRKDCASCVNKTVLGLHDCHFCEVDQKCHDVTSLVSPCTPSFSKDDCISTAPTSSCTKRSVDFCREPSALQPRQIHIALAGPNGMRVAWKTSLRPKVAVVRFSEHLSGSAGSVSAAERSVQYLPDYGYHHVAKLDGLVPGSRYEYRIECDGVLSPIKSFITPATGSSQAQFLFIADMGYLDNGNAVVTRKRLDALKGSSDMTIIAGDIAYADDSFTHVGGCALGFCYESVYDGFMENMSDVMDTKPFMTAVGNHESECHSPACLLSGKHAHLRNFTAYNARFAMPSSESGGQQNMWYSFDYASVHFVVINTETDFKGANSENYGDSCIDVPGVLCQPAGHFAADGEYLRWLEADLDAANSRRSERPWVVAVGHRPWIYGARDGKGLEKNDAAVKAAHADLFEKYGVDLYMTGHQHSYHRMMPINGSTATPIVVSGGAGCDEMKLGTPFEFRNSTDKWDYMSRFDEQQVGILKATATTLTWNAIISETGRVFDTLTLTKEPVPSSRQPLEESAFAFV